MTAAELNALMERNGLTGLKGTLELARRVGSTWRTVYRWRSGQHALKGPAAKAVLDALATPQAKVRRVKQAARKSSKTSK
jgi:hypothetical protein